MIASARPCPPVPPLNLHGKEGLDEVDRGLGLPAESKEQAFRIARKVPERLIALRARELQYRVEF